jgi:hypothetical protein
LAAGLKACEPRILGVMRAWRSCAALQLSAVAGVAVLVAHWAAYLVAVPHAGLRDELLLTSGHGYWLLAVKASLVLGTAALVASAIDALRRRARPDDAPGWTWRGALISLVVVQLCAFTLLEVGERMLAGEPWLTMLHHDVYAWGLLAQLLIAPVGAALLALAARALRNVAGIRVSIAAAAPRRSLAVALPAAPAYLPPRDWCGTFSTRGPPA